MQKECCPLRQVLTPHLAGCHLTQRRKNTETKPSSLNGSELSRRICTKRTSLGAVIDRTRHSTAQWQVTTPRDAKSRPATTNVCRVGPPRTRHDRIRQASQVFGGFEANLPYKNRMGANKKHGKRSRLYSMPQRDRKMVEAIFAPHPPLRGTLSQRARGNAEASGDNSAQRGVNT